MATPVVTLINGPDVTIPGVLAMPNIGGSDKVALIGHGFVLMISNISTEQLELLGNVAVEAIINSLVKRDASGKIYCAGLESSAGIVANGDIGTGAVNQVNLSGTPSLVGIKIRASDGQTANLQEWNDLDNTPGAWLDKDYTLHVRGLALVGSGQGIPYFTGSKILFGSGGSEGNVGGLNLPWIPARVIATVSKVDVDGLNIFCSVTQEDMDQNGFFYSLSGIPQDGSKLDYVLFKT